MNYFPLSLAFDWNLFITVNIKTSKNHWISGMRGPSMMPASFLAFLELGLFICRDEAPLLECGLCSHPPPPQRLLCRELAVQGDSIGEWCIPVGGGAYFVCWKSVTCVLILRGLTSLLLRRGWTFEQGQDC